MLHAKIEGTVEDQPVDETFQCEGLIGVAINADENMRAMILGNLSRSDIICMIGHLINNVKDSVREAADDPLDIMLCAVLEASTEPLDRLISLMVSLEGGSSHTDPEEDEE